MAAILSEHETQERIIRGQKSALDNIVLDLSSLRLMGKDKESTVSRLASPVPTPAAESTEADETTQPPVDDEKHIEGVESGEVAEKEDGEDVELLDPLSVKLNSAAKDATSHSATPLSSRREARSRNDPTLFDQAEDDDIEMGEVAEHPKQTKPKRKVREELEEGEASDSSSALSDPPDD